MSFHNAESGASLHETKVTRLNGNPVTLNTTASIAGILVEDISDPTAPTLWVANSTTPGDWTKVSASGFSVVSPAGNVSPAVKGKTYLMDSSAARSIQLPTPAADFFFYVKDKTGTMNTFNTTLLRAASESIEGLAASYILEANYGFWLVFSDGTNWFIA